MSPKLRNWFFAFGLAAVVVMFLTLDVDFGQLWAALCRAGYWLVGVIGIWVVIYAFNAASWYCLIHNGERPAPVGYWRVLKLTVSGFALNYATPFGLMGGEPYRIMELSPALGTPRATSSVILYVMMHIFSHICFWLASIVLYAAMYKVSFFMGMLLAVTAVVLLLLVYFFMRGYQRGMVVKTFRLLQSIPLVKGWAARFYARQQEALQKIDRQIAELHSRRRSTFYASFGFEFVARVLTSMELFFILKILTPEVNFLDCVLIMAFTSLFANLFFFSPMQLGAREGGFALAVGGLALSPAFGLYMSLITRVRELFWIAVGVLLMKVGNRRVRPDEPKTELVATKTELGQPKADIGAYIFDYGGTLDTGGTHWAHVLWDGYLHAGTGVTEQQFREAYVYAERALARQPVIVATDTFRDVLRKKVTLQFEYLKAPHSLLSTVVDYCYAVARRHTEESRRVLLKLRGRCPLVLVTNFYGNMHSVLRDFGMEELFQTVVESAVVGVRKPDPAIFRKALDFLGLPPQDVCVVGDSMMKDIMPAKSLGCHTVWLRGRNWDGSPDDESLPDACIDRLEELL
ncbi:MAG: HAD-IA family hydrolase [Bacteroidaceae bacterium]|nr:HAD-IA family hydrolase [Bacteroidaceae bacterium]